MMKVAAPDFHTYGGTPVWVRFPWRTQLTLDDIKRPLLGIRRYNGAIDCRLVTHSLLVARLVERNWPTGSYALSVAKPFGIAYGALHDFPETIVHDLVNGLKKHLPEHTKLEDPWLERMLHGFGVPAEIPSSEYLANEAWIQVKSADFRAFIIEATYFGHAAAKIATKNMTHLQATSEELALLTSILELDPDTQWEELLDCIVPAQTEESEWLRQRSLTQQALRSSTQLLSP